MGHATIAVITVIIIGIVIVIRFFKICEDLLHEPQTRKAGSIIGPYRGPRTGLSGHPQTRDRCFLGTGPFFRVTGNWITGF